MKRCQSCKQELPETAFGRCKYWSDGLAKKCRTCHRDYQRASRGSEGRGTKEPGGQLLHVVGLLPNGDRVCLWSTYRRPRAEHYLALFQKFLEGYVRFEIEEDVCTIPPHLEHQRFNERLTSPGRV